MESVRVLIVDAVDNRKVFDVGGKKVGYLFFNIFGAVFFTVIIYLLNWTVGLPFMSKLVNRSSIATIHLMFNLLTSLMLLPFSKKVSELTEKIVGGDDEKPEDKELAKLDDNALAAADVNNDGKITGADCLVILRYTIKMKNTGRTGEYIL